MPAKPKPLEALTPTPKREADVPEVIWALPIKLATLSAALGFFQADVARVAAVNQSAVSRWLHYKGLADLPAARIIMIERGLGLKPGALLPQADPETFSVLEQAIALGVDPSLVLALSDQMAGERMKQFSKTLRQAILGIVHVYQVNLDQAAAMAERAITRHPTEARADRLDAAFWYDRMRDDAARASRESGEYPSVGKIAIAQRSSK